MDSSVSTKSCQDLAAAAITVGVSVRLAIDAAFEDLGKAGSHTARSGFLRRCKISDLITADFFNLENWGFSHEPGNNFTEI